MNRPNIESIRESLSKTTGGPWYVAANKAIASKSVTVPPVSSRGTITNGRAGNLRIVTGSTGALYGRGDDIRFLADSKERVEIMLDWIQELEERNAYLEAELKSELNESGLRVVKKKS